MASREPVTLLAKWESRQLPAAERRCVPMRYGAENAAGFGADYWVVIGSNPMSPTIEVAGSCARCVPTRE